MTSRDRGEKWYFVRFTLRNRPTRLRREDKKEREGEGCVRANQAPTKQPAKNSRQHKAYTSQPEDNQVINRSPGQLSRPQRTSVRHVVLRPVLEADKSTATSAGLLKTNAGFEEQVTATLGCMQSSRVATPNVSGPNLPPLDTGSHLTTTTTPNNIQTSFKKHLSLEMSK